MIERMLIPLDGSRAAEAVLGRAAALLKAGRGTAVLLHVVAPADSAPEDVRVECHRAHHYLTRVAKRLYSKGVSVLTQVVIGEPSREILRAALEEEADLVAMTGHGRGGKGEWPLGSVAGRVLRASRTPVLLVPGEAKAGGAFRRILLRLDGGVEAAAVVGALAEGIGAKVVLGPCGKGRKVLARALDVMTRLEIPTTVRA